MKLDADFHNFGQLVTQEERASEIYFRKPRPVFWERFFFGKTSPLKTVFNSESVANVFFNLEVEITNGHGGFSKKVFETDINTIDNTHAYNFGLLLAYCYIFGIRDLHKGNVIRKKSHLQVIDAEVVFSKILLPNETLLLPFKETTFEICAAKKAFSEEAKISIENLTQLLSGYLDLFGNVIKSREKLLEIFKEHRQTMLKIPVRHIMRDTASYRKWREQKISPIIPFCQNELMQLDRGDVPYFFKFIGDNALYAYSSPTGDYEPVIARAEFQKGIDRDASDPVDLLDTTRLANNLLPTGSLFLLKKLLPKNFVGTINGHDFSVDFSPDGLSLTFGGRTFINRTK